MPIFKNIGGILVEYTTTQIMGNNCLGVGKPDGETITVDADGTLHARGGGSTISPKPVSNISVINANQRIVVSWEDPDDIVIQDITFSKWEGTKLVMNENGYPNSPSDGTVILDNKENDKYKTDGYTVQNLVNNKVYYFALFPYSKDGVYNYEESNRFLGTPSVVRLDNCTNVKAIPSMGKVSITWDDPDETKTINGETATWKNTVLVYKEGSIAPISLDDGIIAVTETTRNEYSQTPFEVTGLTDGNTYSFSLFAVSTDDVSSSSETVTAELYSTLVITTDEVSLYGKDVSISNGTNSVQATFDDNGKCTVIIPWIGETTITSTDDTNTANSKVDILAYEKTYSADLSFLKIVTFADGTDEEIAAMIQAHYDNKINITDYWAVGDKRNVNLSAMSATGVGESHRAQTVQFAIADFEHDNLTTAINGHTKAAVTLTQVDCLMDSSNASSPTNGSGNTENGYMNNSNTNSGGWTSCARRTWCNSVYYNALPSTIKSTVKEVKKLTSAGDQSSTINTTNDKVFLLSEIEIFGSTSYSKSGEGSQYEYYKTTANRYKLPKWGSSSNSHIYWDRSPYGSGISSFCDVNDYGNANYYYASDTNGFAPCLCI